MKESSRRGATEEEEDLKPIKVKEDIEREIAEPEGEDRDHKTT